MRRILLTLLLVALCAVHQSTLKAQDLVGRWELTAVTDRRGQVLPPAKDGRMTLLITGVNGDILSGNIRLWSDPKQPPEKRPCGALLGKMKDNSHVTLMFLVTGDSAPAMIMDAEVRLDSMFTQGRMRDGTNVLGAALWFVFVRVSNDAHLGCLTRA